MSNEFLSNNVFHVSPETPVGHQFSGTYDIEDWLPFSFNQPKEEALSKPVAFTVEEVAKFYNVPESLLAEKSDGPEPTQEGAKPPEGVFAETTAGGKKEPWEKIFFAPARHMTKQQMDNFRSDWKAIYEGSYTFIQYEAEAARTESPPDEAMWLRFLRCSDKFREYIELLLRLTHNLDVLKKYIYYNKAVLPLLYDHYGRSRTFAASCPPLEAHSVDSYDPMLLQLWHGVLGIATESGEMVQGICNLGMVKVGDEQARNKVLINLIEEVGDNQWYAALLARALKTRLAVICKKNADKLKVRYPEKFNEDQAAVRDLDAEFEAVAGVDLGDPKGSFSIPQSAHKVLMDIIDLHDNDASEI